MPIERVYLITPRTGYADNALMTIARLYEEIKNPAAQSRPSISCSRNIRSTPFKDAAEKDLGASDTEQSRRRLLAVDNVRYVDNMRYWEAQNSVRVVVDVSGEVNFKQGEAKNPDRVFIDVAPAN